MAVFTIGTPGGRKLTIDAPDEATAIKGAQEWDAANPAEKSTGYGDAVKQGLSNVVGGVGETLKQYGPEATQGVAEKLRGAGESLAPSNYDPATVVTKDGINAGNVPRAVVESAPGLGAAIGAARLMPGPWWLKALAGGLAGTAQSLGRNAKESAYNRTGDPNAEPTSEEKTSNAIAAVPSTALGAFGVGRFLPAGAVKGIGAKGAMNALKRLGTTTAVEGGVEAGQEGIEQIGRTATSDAGPTLDPYAMANAGVIGAATGGTLASPRAARDVSDAAKYRNVDEQVASQLANRLTATGIDVKKPKGGYEAFTQVRGDLNTELADLTKSVKEAADLPVEAKNALARARSGNVSESDLAHITTAVRGLPEAEAITTLVAQRKLLNDLTDTKAFRDGSFAGGVSGMMERGVRAIASPIGAATAAGVSAAGLGGANMAGVFTAAPQAFAALYGGYQGAKMLDRFTGNRSPAHRFTRKFADPSVAIRPDVPPSSLPGMRPGEGPWGLNPGAPGPTGPRVPLPAAPKPPASFDTPVDLMARLNMTDRGVRASPDAPSSLLGRLNATDVRRRGLDEVPQGYDKRVMDAVRAMNKAQRQAADIINHGAVRLNALDTTLQRQPAPDIAPDSAPDPLQLPKSITGPAQTVAKGLALRAKLIGEQQAQQEALASPALEQTVGTDAVQNPAAGKRMSQMISQARAIMKLRQDPAEAAAEKEAAAVEKLQAKQEAFEKKKADKEEAAKKKAADKAEVSAAKAMAKLKSATSAPEAPPPPVVVEEAKPERAVETPEPFWTDARIEAVRKGIADGKTTQQIADELGTTKNAVIGKSNRMKMRQSLPTPPQPEKAPKLPPKVETVVTERPAPQVDLSLPEDGSIPEFMRREKKPAMAQALAEAPKKTAPPPSADLDTPEGRKEAVERAKAAEPTISSDDGAELALLEHFTVGMSPEDAGRAIADYLVDTGSKTKNQAVYLEPILVEVQRIRDKLANKLAKVLKVNPDVLIGHLRAVSTPSEARSWRDKFIDFAPDKAREIEDILSDDVIDEGTAWREARKKKKAK